MNLQHLSAVGSAPYSSRFFLTADEQNNKAELNSFEINQLMSNNQANFAFA
jgi:hypothetical protein